MGKFTLKPKDQELLDTLDILKVMTSSQIERLFFKYKESQCRRCKQLVNNKKMKCYREGFGKPMIYYRKRKPTQQIKSMLIVSEVYVMLHELGYNVKDFQREYSVPITDNFTIRPDGHFLIAKDGIEYEFFIEVDNCKKFSSEKYYRAMKEGYYAPPILSISNRPRQIYEGMEVLKIRLDLSNFKEVITSYV